MPTRQEYDEYYKPLIGWELDAYERKSEEMNDYEKTRNRNYRPLAEASLEERSKMENMISDMRRRNPEETRQYARKLMVAEASGQPVKLPTYDNKEVPVSDISYVLAESLQHLYSSEDPKAEYYDWVQTQRQIEIDIYSNGTTDDEIKARNDFIGFLNDRETELKLIIMLYALAERNGTGYYKELAQNKLSFLQFKLSELRRLRDRTQATKGKSDEEEKREQQRAEIVQQATRDAAMLAAVEGLEQARQSYLENQKSAKEFDTAIDGVLTHYLPVTGDVEEVMRKKERLSRNREEMLDLFKSLRMGVSKEEKERRERGSSWPMVRRVNGFDRYRYNRLENEQTA